MTIVMYKKTSENGIVAEIEQYKPEKIYEFVKRQLH